MKVLGRLAVFGLASILMCLGVLAIFLHRLNGAAERILATSYQLSTQDHPPTLRDLQRRFGNELVQPDPCIASGCKYEVIVSNLPLAQIRLLPYAALSSSFWVKDNAVEENVVQLWTRNRGGRMILAYADARYCEECDGYDIVPCDDSIASVASGSVRLGTRSGSKQKRSAFAFNPSCLTSLRGCGNISDIAPALWRGTSKGEIQCRAVDEK